MSSPRSIGGGSGPLGVREGTRIVLREITASLHNSPPQASWRKSANDTPAVKTTEHEVKVQFTREFADVGPSSYSGPESLSSASSFQSLASTLSSKSSSGICVDSGPDSPQKVADISYVNAEIPGVEDLIFACSNIQLAERELEPCQQDQFSSESKSSQSSQESSRDQTFTSATDESDSCVITDLSKQNIYTSIEDSSLNLEADKSALTCVLNSSNTSDLGLNRTRELPCTSVSNVSHKSNSTLDNDTSLNRIEESLQKFHCFHESEDLPLIVKPADQVENSTINSLLITDNKTTDSNVNVGESEDSEDFKLSSVVLNSQSNLSLKVDHSGEERAITPTELVINPVLLNASPSVVASTGNAQSPPLPDISGDSPQVENDIAKPLESSAKNVKEVLNSVSSNLSSCSVDGFISDVTSVSSKFPNDPIPEFLPAVTSEIQKLDVSEIANVIEEIAENIPEIKQESNDIVSEASTQENPEQIPKCTVETFEERVIKNENETIDQVNENQSVDNFVLALQDSKDLIEQTSQREIKEDTSREVTERNHLPIVTETVTIEKGSVLPASTAVSSKEQSSLDEEDLDKTITLHDISINLDTALESEQYVAFKPQQQSTTLGINDHCNFDKLELAAQAVANDIYNSSLEAAEESDRFVTATCEIFQDPSCFDFLLTKSTDKNPVRDLRAESLYVKFDPLVSNESMLPQGNSLLMREEGNCKNETPVPNIDTPKRNPALMAIDRLLFYSPISARTPCKVEETQETNQVPTEEPEPEPVPVIDANMVKELELVRSTVLRLEEELERQKKEHDVELEKQRSSFQEKINRLQAQLAQEIKNKNQMTVVVDEYEKSISRLVAERERDRANLEQERAKLQEELQTANHHLNNTEAAFNDVHLKYERVKGVVSAFKSNEIVLKESIQENEITIKALENRYDQLKSHAMTQLEKANLELDSIRKQNEAETVRLHAMLRKAELKSNSLAEMVEQKSKENKELTQILDEVIARVGHQNAD